MEGLVTKLSNRSVLDNTYIVFTSDNGWYHGEHRIPEEKSRPYEEAIHMPLVIRGPGVLTNVTTDKLALNIDFYPTFAELGRATPSTKVDGRSLRPVLEGAATNWRSVFLLEEKLDWYTPDESYFGVLTSDGRKYVEYENGARELYDLKADPYELENAYSGTPPADLKTSLDALKTCAGASCRSADNGS